MAAWLVWSVLILAINSEANVSSNDIHKEIKEGQEKVQRIANISQENVEEIRSTLNIKYIDLDFGEKESVIEGMKLHKTIDGEMNKIVNESFEEGIDRNQNIRIFLESLKIKENTEGGLQNILQSFMSEVTVMHKKKRTKLQSIEKLLHFTNEISTGIYEGLMEKMTDCKDSPCIAKLIGSAEGKQKSLTKIFEKYKKEMSDITGDLDAERQNCFNNTRKKFGRALTNLKHDLEDLSSK